MKVRLVFTSGPGPDRRSGSFIEAEDLDGNSIAVGEWKPYDNPVYRGMGWWVLEIEMAERADPTGPAS